MGPNRCIEMADVGTMDSEDGVVALLGHDGSILVQLHMENSEDQQLWASAIRALLSSRRGAGNSAAGPEGEEDEVCMLQARSQQLQNRIGILEGLGKRRDLHLQKMQKRVDGAMRMLAAVKDMCAQQRRVLDAQKVAIAELRDESGEPMEDGGEGGRPTAVERSTQAEPEEEAEEVASEDAGQGAEPDARDPVEAMAEEEIAAKTRQMLELLQQADDMQKALHALQSLQSEAEAPSAAQSAPAGTARAAPPVSASATLQAAAQATAPTATSATAPADGASEDSEEVDPEVVLQRLQQLQAEKQRYEGMVRDSQQEHEDLLKRLSDMRSLMASLGIPDDGQDDD